MNQPGSPKPLAKKPLASLCLGVAAFVLGLLNYFFTQAVTVLSIVGFFAGAAAIVLAIMVRKEHPDHPPLAASIGLVGGIVGLLWNLAFFVACSNLACGGINMF